MGIALDYAEGINLGYRRIKISAGKRRKSFAVIKKATVKSRA